MTAYPISTYTRPNAYSAGQPRAALAPRDHAPIVVSLALLLASATCVALYVLRVTVSGTLLYFFMNWNLVLAWIPLVCALIAYGLYSDRSKTARASTLFFGGVWLLFYPNAPYMLTDLMHLYDSGPILVWLDLAMLLAYAFTSLLLGFASLYLMQSLVSRASGRLAGWVFVVVTQALSGFGIYLGRVLRWNSWDIVANPLGLAVDILDRFINPFAHLRTWGVSFLFTVLCLSAYVVLFAFTQLRTEPAAL